MTLRARMGRIPSQIWVLVAAAFVIALGYGLISPVLPNFAKSFDVGAAAASAVISAFAFFRLLFAPVSGQLITRIGERPTYLLGLLIVAVSTLATAFATSYEMLITVRALGGIGSTMFTVSAMNMIVRFSPPELRGRVSSLYAGSFLIGGVLGPVVGGLLAGFGMQMPFVVYGISLLVAMAVVWTCMPRTDKASAAAAATKVPMTVGEAWAHPASRAAFVSSFSFGWTNFGVRIAHVPLLGAALGAEPWVVGTVMAIFAGGNALAVVNSGRLADLRGRRPLMLAGLVIAGAATSAFGLSDNVWLLGTLSFIAGVGTGTMGPAQQATMADVIGTERGGAKVLASFQMSGDLGGILGPILAGALADHYGFGASFLLSGVMMLAVIPLWLRAPETRPGRRT